MYIFGVFRGNAPGPLTDPPGLSLIFLPYGIMFVVFVVVIVTDVVLVFIVVASCGLT